MIFQRRGRFPKVKHDWVVQIIDFETGSVLYKCVETKCDYAKETAHTLLDAPLFEEYEELGFEISKRVHNEDGTFTVESPLTVCQKDRGTHA